MGIQTTWGAGDSRRVKPVSSLFLSSYTEGGNILVRGGKKKKEEWKDLPAAWLTNKAKNNKNK